LGGLDPVDTISGVQERLKSLGFYTGEASGQMDDMTKAGIAAFQASKNLSGDGAVDQPTKDALKAAFGS
jgi:peptidoglycan hydrolase-like protein with peptidoglycan-binding domain